MNINKKIIIKLLLGFLFSILIFSSYTDVYAYDGYATVGRGKYYYAGQGGILDTNWYSLTNYSFNDEILSFPSGYTYFINGAEYVAAINFNGEQSFTGSVLIPVVLRDQGGGNYPNLVSQSNFHIGIDSNFGVYNVNPSITRFDSNCGTTIRQSQTQIVYTYCQYFIEFNFVLASPVYGAKNLNFGIYSASPSQTILTTYDNVFYQSFPLNVWSTSLGLNPNFYLADNYNGGGGSGSGGNSSTDLTNVENSLDDVNDKLDDVNDNLTDVNDNLADVNSSINDLNDNILDDDVDDSVDDASDFFNNFNAQSHGIRGIITAPLRLINSLTTATCNPLTFQLPILHNQVVLPCMRPIYENYFGVFFSLWQLITTGLISYNVSINIYSKIHNLQNPNNDKIEVLNL